MAVGPEQPRGSRRAASFYLTPELLRRGVAIDARFAALRLGLVDACVMAIAEREGLPILTFDFDDFRAAPGERGPWPLVVDESRYHDNLT